MEDVEIKVQRLGPHAHLPLRATPGATGLDLFASLDTPLALTRHPQLVPTGIAIEIPAGTDAQIRPRSGLSSQGIGVAFGTVDADYRGELLVTMWTFGDLDEYLLYDGDRIAQLVLARVLPARIVEVPSLTPTDRGASGHGSTGR
jgi:dUTP pyrophosphatase